MQINVVRRLIATWKHEVGRAELLDVAQSLELGSVHDLYAQMGNFDVTVDRVIDDFRVGQNRRPLPFKIMNGNKSMPDY